MARKTIPHQKIISEIKEPLNETKEAATAYETKTADTFAALGATIMPLEKAARTAADNTGRFIADGTKIVAEHPTPPQDQATEKLAEKTRSYPTIDTSALIQDHDQKTASQGKR